jgi:polar amino acid transport system permease protein
MPESNKSSFLTYITVFIIVMTLLFTWFGFQKMDYSWDFSILKPYLWDEANNRPGLILQGLWGTFYISFLSIIFGTILGVIVGFFLLSKHKIPRYSAIVFVDVLRNTPVLVQLYLVYFVIGTPFDLSPEKAGIATLSFFCSAYVADIFRGTIHNFDKGQLDAAKSLGLHPLHIATYVVGPQALRRMLPPLIGQFVSLVKDSSLVSVIAVLDLTKAALNVVSGSFRSFETWIFIAGLYLIVNTILSSLGRFLEKKLSASLR